MHFVRRLSASLVALLAGLLLSSCDLLYDPAECATWEAEVDEKLARGAMLLPGLPSGADGAPISLVLNEAALNGLFRELSSQEIPELTTRFSIPLVPQDAQVSLRPSIPLLQLASSPTCDGCLSARVPLDVTITLPGSIRPRAQGAISVEVPVGFVEEDDTATAFVARFQSIRVTGLELGALDGLNANLRGIVESLASELATAWLRERFSDVRIARFATWTIGGGSVRLAPRGPFVAPDQQSIRFSLVTNLPGTDAIGASGSLLPEGADAALHLHPSVLGAMGRRMNHEGFLPSRYSTTGTPTENGSLRMALVDVTPGDEDRLHSTSEIVRSGSLCGGFTLGAALALAVEPQRVSLSIADVSITNTRGAARLLDTSDQLTGGLLSGLLDTLDFTINYDGLQAGEAGNDPALQTVGARVDASGVRVALRLPRPEAPAEPVP